MTETIDVKVGQVWQDCDRRMSGRRVVVRSIENGYAYCYSQSKPSLQTRIALRRMRPTSTGYRLVGVCEKPLLAEPHEMRAKGGAKRGERRSGTTMLSLHQHDFRRVGDEWRCAKCGSKSETVGKAL